jgi:hypothetical protein
VQEDNYISIVHRQLLEQKFGIRFAPQELAKQFSYELGPYEGSMAFHGFWNVINFMPKDVTDFFVTHRPPGMFDELHRAHHTIIALAVASRLDLIEQCADEIRSSPAHAQLYTWLSSENFDNKQPVLDLIKS